MMKALKSFIGVASVLMALSFQLANGEAVERWVPAGNPGEDLTFFKVGNRQLRNSELRVGDVVRPDRAIWIRPAAADWAHRSGPVPQDASVRIRSLQWVNTETQYGQRLWLSVDYVSNVVGSTPARRTAPTKEKVVSCLAAGYQTVRDMFICSGGMFSPDLLSSCILGGSCDHGLPGYAFDGFLSSRQETWTQSLTVTSPSFNADEVVKCISTQPQTESAKCVATQLYPQPSPEISACGSFDIDPDALARCVVSKLGSPWDTVVACVMGSQRNNPSACLTPLIPDLAQRINTISNCVQNAGPEVSRESLRCLVVLLPNEYQSLATCILADDFSNTNQKMQCLGGIPTMRPAFSLISCASLNDSGSNRVGSCSAALGHPLTTQARDCLQRGSVASCLPNDATAACVVKYPSSSSALITCLTERDPDLQNIVRIGECLLNASNASDFVSVCLPVDERIRIPLACALQETTRDGLLACAAAGYLNADQRRIVSCAMSSQSYVEFAVCYAGIKLTREQATVLKCLGQFGPTPEAAACAAGKLTADELIKCQRAIGTSDGCFGPNNAVVQAFKQLGEIQLAAPGIARDVLVASIQLAATNVQQVGKNLTDLADGLDKCARDPGQCGPVVVEFCAKNPIACATGFPIPGRGDIPRIQINLPPPPQIPAPSCNWQWKCDGLKCQNMCG